MGANETFDLEINMLRKIAGAFPRTPRQLNLPMEADAEILDLRGLPYDYLVFKIDGLHEEISEGLYQSPFLIGWMAVTVTMSDLAAVGADPIGLLLGMLLQRTYDNASVPPKSTQFEQGAVSDQWLRYYGRFPTYSRHPEKPYRRCRNSHTVCKAH